MSQNSEVSLRSGQTPNIAESDLADLATSVLHEFNNALNSISLHLAVMEQKGAPAGWASELAEIRREVTSAGAKARRLQQLCNVGQPVLEPVDANRLVRKVVKLWQRQNPGLDLHVTLGRDIPPVRATTEVLERLLSLLVEDAVASLEAGKGRVAVSSARTERGIELRITDTGAPLPPNADGILFEPFAPGRAGGENLRLSVCKALAKRLQGDIRAENLADGSVAMIVRLHPAT